MADINALIATLPDRIQENALRQMQTNLGGQRYQQNALAMGQQLGAQNALAGIYSDPRNIDPTTGLPRLGSMGPLITTNPSMGMDFLELESKLQDSHSRANLTNLRASEYSASLFDQYVVKPLLEYEDSLDPNLPPEQRAQKIAAEKDRLTKDATATLGLPPEVQARWEALQPKPEWRPQSALWNERQERIDKEWHTEEEIDPESGLPRKYTWNPAYPGHFFALDHRTPLSWTPTGIGKPMGGESKYFTETWTGPDGKPQSATFEQDAFSRKLVPGTREPYQTHPGGLIAPASAKGQISSQLGPTEQVKVRKPDGTTEIVSAQPMKRQPGQPAQYYDPAGNLIDPKTIIEAKLPAAQAGVPMTSVEQRYVGRLRVLGGPSLSQGFGARDYLPGIAEQAIRSSLDLPDDHVLTERDAEMAAANDVAVNKGMHAQGAALQAVAKQSAFVQGFEQTAERNLNLVEQLAQKGLVKTGAPIWNRTVQWMKRQFTGDPDLAALDLALETARDEYIRVVTQPGATGGAMLPEGARETANRLFNDGMTFQALKSSFGAAKQDMGNRVESIEKDYNSIMNSLRNKGAFAGMPPVQPGEGREKFTLERSARQSYPIPKNIPSDVPEDRGIEGPDGAYVRRGTQLVPAIKRDGKWVAEVEPKKQESSLPAEGPLPGAPHLLPKYSDLGRIRPLGPGEYVQNPDGSWSSEITRTVTNPDFQGGKPSVIPTVWIVNGTPQRVNERQAISYAVLSGLTFPRFKTLAEAEKFATDREKKWQGVKAGDTSVPPLWKRSVEEQR